MALKGKIGFFAFKDHWYRKNKCKKGSWVLLNQAVKCLVSQAYKQVVSGIKCEKRMQICAVKWRKPMRNNQANTSRDISRRCGD
jgi:hypothetical protein